MSKGIGETKNKRRKAMKYGRRLLYVLFSLAVFWAATPLAWAKNCGDTAGPGGTNVTCDCGDTLVTTTTLISPAVNPAAGDPVVSTNDNDFCPGDGLIINTPKVNLNLGGLAIRGAGVGVGIRIDGVNVDKVQIRNGAVRGFETGIGTSAGSTTNQSTIRKIVSNANSLIAISLEGNRNIVDLTDTLDNGDTGVKIMGDDATLTFIRSSQNGNHGIDVIGDGAIVRSGQVNRNIGTGIQVIGNSSVLDHNLATKNFDGIVIAGNGDGNPATLELLKNKASDNDGDGIRVTGDSHDMETNQSNLNGGDGIMVAGTANRLADNKGNENDGNGIIVTGGGNINGGGNLGKKNDGAVQCQIDGQNC